MSGEDDCNTLVKDATATMMTAVQAMFTELRDSMINNNISINNSINDINNTLNNIIYYINKNMNNLRAEINSNSDATRAELLERIDQRSRLSSRSSTRTGSRAVSPKTLMAQLNTKLKSDADTPDVAETPRANSLAPVLPPPKTRMNQVNESKSGTNIPDIAETPHANSFGPDLTLTQVFRDKDAADRFEEENILRRGRPPKVSNRDNIHAYRDSFNAQNRPNDPMHREQCTRTTPICKAKLDGPLTLEKCLTFQKDILDFQNKFNVEVRLTSYLSDDLKAEMKARF
jgi:hypothetical protein